ncbi:hypothetical protein C0995_011531 [Termitomyces sp. Mi166|nr:hypothetical protein C0995_011531 [Termitomyces sp. Mi166\
MTQNKQFGSMEKSVGTFDPITIANIIAVLQQLGALAGAPLLCINRALGTAYCPHICLTCQARELNTINNAAAVTTSPVASAQPVIPPINSAGVNVDAAPQANLTNLATAPAYVAALTTANPASSAQTSATITGVAQDVEGPGNTATTSIIAAIITTGNTQATTATAQVPGTNTILAAAAATTNGQGLVNAPVILPAPAPNAILANPSFWYCVIVRCEVEVFHGWWHIQPLVFGVSGAGCKRYSTQAAVQHAFDDAHDLGLVEVRF